MNITHLARRSLLILLGVLLLSGIVLTLLWQFWRPGMAAYRAHLAPVARPGEGAVQAYFFGVSAVLLRSGDTAVFIDPFFSRPGGPLRLLGDPAVAPDPSRIKTWLARAGVKTLDAVLVSHSHYDHAMDAGLVARMTGARLIGSPSTLNIGRGAGLAENRLQDASAGQPIVIGDFTLRFVVSRHAGATGGRPRGDIEQPLAPPARLSQFRQGGSFSILIEHAQGNVLHHGSAGFVPGALRRFQADVALLGVALIDELEPYLQQTVRAVGATRVYPLHWDDFTRPLSQSLTPMPMVVRLDRLFAQFPADLSLRTLPLAQPVVLLPVAAGS